MAGLPVAEGARAELQLDPLGGARLEPHGHEGFELAGARADVARRAHVDLHHFLARPLTVLRTVSATRASVGPVRSTRRSSRLKEV